MSHFRRAPFFVEVSLAGVHCLLVCVPWRLRPPSRVRSTKRGKAPRVGDRGSDVVLPRLVVVVIRVLAGVLDVLPRLFLDALLLLLRLPPLTPSTYSYSLFLM